MAGDRWPNEERLRVAKLSPGGGYDGRLAALRFVEACEELAAAERDGR